MALTRDFKETVMARAQRDARFRQALFTEALNVYLAGDAASGKVEPLPTANAVYRGDGSRGEPGSRQGSIRRAYRKAGRLAARARVRTARAFAPRRP